MAFRTPSCIYCYIAIPYGFKNVGATYQRLVENMLTQQLGKTMEVHIDDMVVKSRKAENRLQDLKEAFNIMDKHNMKPNPSKCHFVSRLGSHSVTW